MSTAENLQAAFAGESQANRKYLAFAKKADTEGLKGVAKLFRAVADAETIHAHNHLRVMNGVKSTAENLQAAIDGENYEFKKMYPSFLSEAEKEGNKAAVISFKGAMSVEEIHHGLYTKALEAVKAGKDLESLQYFICDICGHTVTGGAPDKCPVCGALKNRFVEVK